jgi:hypothetical protein
LPHTMRQGRRYRLTPSYHRGGLTLRLSDTTPAQTQAGARTFRDRVPCTVVVDLTWRGPTCSSTCVGAAAAGARRARTGASELPRAAAWCRKREEANSRKSCSRGYGDPCSQRGTRRFESVHLHSVVEMPMLSLVRAVRELPAKQVRSDRHFGIRNMPETIAS